MLHAFDLPKKLWAEAVAHSNYIKNRVPTSAITEPTTPYERMWGEKPDVSGLHEFGTSCWVLDRSPTRTKLDPKSHAFAFTGISGESKAFKYYDAAANKIKKSCDVRFFTDRSTSTDIEIVPPQLAGENSGSEQAAGTGGVRPELSSQNGKASDQGEDPIVIVEPPAPRRSARAANQERPDYAVMNDPFR